MITDADKTIVGVVGAGAASGGRLELSPRFALVPAGGLRATATAGCHWRIVSRVGIFSNERLRGIDFGFRNL